MSIINVLRKNSNNLLLIIGLLSVAGCYAQVGINTKNPLGIFHIDTKSDTQPNGNNALDDVIVSSQGYLGLGTTTPSTYLHIKTATAGTNTTTPVYGMRLVDGSQADKRVLMSDDNGLASWGNVMPENAITAVRTNTGVTQPIVNGTVYYNVGATLTLPKGKWLVEEVLYMAGSSTPAAEQNDRFSLSSTFSEVNVAQTSTNIASASIEGSKYISGTFWKAGTGNILYGTFIINNPSVTTTYYCYIGNIVVYGTQDPVSKLFQVGVNGEDNIVAFPLPNNL